MNDMLFGLGVGFIFALGGFLCLGVLISIGELLDIYEKWRNK